jgi:hypothetical protein
MYKLHIKDRVLHLQDATTLLSIVHLAMGKMKPYIGAQDIVEILLKWN